MVTKGKYAVTVEVDREVEHAIKVEQSRRFLELGKRPTIIELVSELLTTTVLALPK